VLATRLERVVARVVNVGHDWFTFTVPKWDHVFTMGRLQVPFEVDEALDAGDLELQVSANLGVPHPSQVRFSFWGVINS
jgi:hypothetical protein